MAPRNDRVAPNTEVRSPARSFLQNVDTFYAPARDRRGPEAIQRGISAIQGVLQERFVEARNDQREDERQQGIADAMREQAGQEMEGVRTGNIFRQNSRFYMAGLNETRGRTAGVEFEQSLSQRWQEWEGRDSDDPEAFRQWAYGQLAEFTDGLAGDQHRLAGALPTAQNAVFNLARQHQAYTDRRIAASAAAAYRAQHEANWQSALTGDVELEDAFVASLGLTEEQFDMDGAVANDTAIEGLVDASNFRNDPNGLYFVQDQIQAGRLRVNPDQAARVSNAIESVESDRDRVIERENARAEAEQRAANQEQFLNVFAQASADPFGTTVSPLQFGGDFTAWNTANGIINTLQAAARETDPLSDLGVQLQFTGAVMEAPDLNSAIQAITTTALSQGTGYATMAQSFMEDLTLRSSAESLIQNPVVRSSADALSRQLLAFERDDLLDAGQIANLRTRGEYLYDLNIARMAANGEINGLNTVDVLEATAVARQRTLEQLVVDFPELTRSRFEAANPDAANALGIAPALAEDEARRTEQANAEIAQQLAEINTQALIDRAAGAIAEAEQQQREQIDTPFISTDPQDEGDLFDIPAPSEPLPWPSPENDAVTPNSTPGVRRAWVGELLANIDTVDIESLTRDQLAVLAQEFNLPLGTFSTATDPELLRQTIQFIARSQGE